MFYVKDKDPLYLKLMKVKVLESVATDNNANDIMNELGYYVTDKEAYLSKQAISAISRLSIRLAKTSFRGLELLLSFLELEQMQHVLATTLIAMRDMLWRYPEQAHDIIPRLAQYLDIVQEPNAVAAIVTMIGEYGQIIPDGPYILEEVIKEWENQPAPVRMQLIVGTLKLFFKRPVEVKPILGKLFVKALDDFSHPDIHDRALFYYRILSRDVEKCKRVVNSLKNASGTHNVPEDLDALKVDRLFEELTLYQLFIMTVLRDSLKIVQKK